jgi:hypothetical protein
MNFQFSKFKNNRSKTFDFLLVFLTFAFLFLTFSQAVYAHTLKIDGSIGVVMHVEPDEDPIVGRKSNFEFEFKDKNNKFKSTDCDCSVSILQNGKVLYNQQLFQNNTDPNLSNATASYYFAEQGKYIVRVSGQSHTDQSFPPFSIDYELRVSRTISAPEQSKENSNWFSAHAHQLIGGVIGFCILGFIIFKSSQNKKTESD